jgi:hypothetical protein
MKAKQSIDENGHEFVLQYFSFLCLIVAATLAQ